MTWRLTKGEYELSKGEGNKLKIKKLVHSNEPIGVLAPSRTSTHEGSLTHHPNSVDLRRQAVSRPTTFCAASVLDAGF